MESDVVLLAPLRRRKGERTPRVLMIYILIEHQSEPDRLMPLRSVDYVVPIFKYQVREWSKTHGSLARIRLYPVLPVVFYTGTRRWDCVGRLVDLVEMGAAFESATPALPKLLSPLPIPGTPNWIQRVNQPLSERQLQALRECIGRRRPFGDPAWTAEVTQRTGFGYTLRPRRRPQKHKE